MFYLMPVRIKWLSSVTARISLGKSIINGADGRAGSFSFIAAPFIEREGRRTFSHGTGTRRPWRKRAYAFQKKAAPRTRRRRRRKLRKWVIGHVAPYMGALFTRTRVHRVTQPTVNALTSRISTAILLNLRSKKVKRWHLTGCWLD